MINTKFDPELLHIAALFNPAVYRATLPILNNYPWATDIGKVLFGEVRPLDYFNEITISSMLSSLMIPDEIQGFLELIRLTRSVTNTNEITELINGVFKYYKVRSVHISINKNQENIDKLVQEIKKIPDSICTGADIVTLGDLTPSQIIEDDLGGLDNVIPSNFNAIRESTPFNGYLRGQVIQWVGAPGRGKSAAMLYEICLAAIHGYKTIWIAMGDLTKYDFITRFAAIITGVEFYKVALNPEKYFNDDVRDVACNIDLITVPAGKLSIEETISIINNNEKYYDIAVIDYDSNFKMKTENMYFEGADNYNGLTEIAKPPNTLARVVHVASQPKIQYWEDLEIPESGAGESSRKQHIIDMMITMGTAGLDIPAGVMWLCKVRRGKPGRKTGYVMEPNGRFKEVPRKEIDLMRTYSSV